MSYIFDIPSGSFQVLEPIPFSIFQPKKISGVYIIRNKSINKIYIGQSINVFSRAINHITELLEGKHSNKSLQGDFKEYGKDSFEFMVIRECEPEELKDFEEFYIWKALKEGVDIYNKAYKKGLVDEEYTGVE